MTTKAKAISGPIARYRDIDNNVKKATVMLLERLKNKTTIKSEIK